MIIDPREFRRFAERLQELTNEEAAEFIQRFNAEEANHGMPNLLERLGEIAEQEEPKRTGAE